MKVIKYIFFSLLSVIVLAMVLAMLVGYVSHDKEEDLQREQIALNVKLQIERYYKQNKHYPQALTQLPIAKDQRFQSYYNERVIRYRYENKNYHLLWIFSGVLGQDGGKHSLSWNGKQYASDRSLLMLIYEDPKPDTNGFYNIDLH